MSWQADPGYLELKRLLIQITGLDYYTLKDDDLHLRLKRRFLVTECTDSRAYIALLNTPGSGEAEWDALVHELTIGETYFFRHYEQFDEIRDTVLPELLLLLQDRKKINIWSAGCSTGAEPFSIAMILRECFSQTLGDWQVKIVATDISREALRKARSGVFEEWAFRTMPSFYRARYFSSVERKTTVSEVIRKAVDFKYHNLVAEPFAPPVPFEKDIDLILCRNVTIYFDRLTCARLIRRFHDCLTPGGWLVVGHAEPNLEFFKDFEVVQGQGAILYRKPYSQSKPAPAVFDWALFTAGLRETTPSALASARRGTPVIADAPFVAPAPSIQAFANQGLYSEALRLCDELILGNKLSPALHLQRGRMLQQLGDFDEAMRALQRSIYLDRDFVLGHYFLGHLLEKQNQKALARREFRIVSRLLQGLADSIAFSEAEGITAGELRRLIQNHVEAA